MCCSVGAEKGKNTIRTAEDAKHSDCGVSGQCCATATQDMQPGGGGPGRSVLQNQLELNRKADQDGGSSWQSAGPGKRRWKLYC